MINKTIVTLDKDMRHYQCANSECRALLFRFGAFNHEFPNKKLLLKIEKNIFRSENIWKQFLTRPQGIGKEEEVFGVILHNTKCRACGRINKHTVIFGKRNDFKIG